METEILLIKTLEHAHEPVRASTHAAGLDFSLPNALALMPNCPYPIDLGYDISMPASHVGLLTIRSSIAKNHQVGLLNTPGIIDEDYQGPLIAILYNHGPTVTTLDAGTRVVQLLCVPITPPNFRQVSTFPVETARGKGGLGSTGKSTVERLGQPTPSSREPKR